MLEMIDSQTFFITDAGLETDMVFNHGFELPAFAAHTLLDSASGRQALREYYYLFLELACETGATLLVDAPTWRAQPHFCAELGVSEAELEVVNKAAVQFVDEVRRSYRKHAPCSVLNAVLGPCGDGYVVGKALSASEAEAYHAQQLSWLAQTQIDMVTAMTFTNSAEAIGAIRAANRLGLSIAMSFTVETDGRLPSGEILTDAIAVTDHQTDNTALYYMINCAHPDHFLGALKDRSVSRRIRGVRCNASRKSHAELDCATELDTGDCDELAGLYTHLKVRMPWLTIWGGCCGTDISHIAAIARALKPLHRLTVAPD